MGYRYTIYKDVVTILNANRKPTLRKRLAYCPRCGAAFRTIYKFHAHVKSAHLEDVNHRRKVIINNEY
ncbi:hypothetical protein BLOT_009538 [Blomia tropicalis]|nr:hypothetical protein BLOT_009538 [Blomia tropicalis]